MNEVASLAVITLALCAGGCSSPSITAVNLDPRSNEPEGIPYYLPKPYLIVTKNIRYIPTPTVGLTQTAAIPGSFDSNGGNTAKQASPGANLPGGNQQKKSGQPGASAQSAGAAADGAGAAGAAQRGGASATPAPGTNAPADSTGEPANSSGSIYGNQVFGPASIAVVPPASISDGLVPQEFFTYQIVYLPDLTQKYGLRIKGGSGEMRATENLINGWMHTGPGPIYLRDSFTADKVTAVGQAVSDIGQTLGQVALSAAGIPNLPGTSSLSSSRAAVNTGAPKPSQIRDYAQISVYELVLNTDASGKKSTAWQTMTNLPSFTRDWIELERAASSGGATQAPGQQENKDAETVIKKGLQDKGWIIAGITVSNDDQSMTVAVSGKQTGKNAGDLTSDAKTAAEDCIKTQNLKIEDGNIKVQTEIK
jgi:hypothetical protein